MLSPDYILTIVIWLIGTLLSVAAIAGAVQVSVTREDAFEAADRQQKWLWFAFLMCAAFAIFFHVPLLNWIGIVVVGVYFFDVRPQIKDILTGNYGW